MKSEKSVSGGWERKGGGRDGRKDALKVRVLN
jgi:hypothetical protein